MPDVKVDAEVPKTTRVMEKPAADAIQMPQLKHLGQWI